MAQIGILIYWISLLKIARHNFFLPIWNLPISDFQKRQKKIVDLIPISETCYIEGWLTVSLHFGFCEFFLVFGFCQILTFNRRQSLLSKIIFWDDLNWKEKLQITVCPSISNLIPSNVFVEQIQYERKHSESSTTCWFRTKVFVSFIRSGILS